MVGQTQSARTSVWRTKRTEKVFTRKIAQVKPAKAAKLQEKQLTENWFESNITPTTNNARWQWTWQGLLAKTRKDKNPNNPPSQQKKVVVTLTCGTGSSEDKNNWHYSLHCSIWGASQLACRKRLPWSLLLAVCSVEYLSWATLVGKNKTVVKFLNRWHIGMSGAEDETLSAKNKSNCPEQYSHLWN